MKTLEQTKYLNISFDKDKGLMLFEWKPTSVDLSEAEFRRNMELEKEVIQNHQPQFILVNSLFFFYTISVETQDWINTEILNSSTKGIPKKIAIIVSKDWISQLSIEQTMNDGNSISEFQTNYFSNLDQAYEWFDSS